MACSLYTSAFSTTVLINALTRPLHDESFALAGCSVVSLRDCAIL